jgi:hypothetical protein
MCKASYQLFLRMPIARPTSAGRGLSLCRSNSAAMFASAVFDHAALRRTFMSIAVDIFWQDGHARVIERVDLNGDVGGRE